MNRYFIELSYDGTNYHGWQVQPNALTIQEIIENALSTILKEKIAVVGAGRTDTGVHASFFVAHFDTSVNKTIRGDSLIFKLNSFLPGDIAVYSVYQVENDKHARFSATHRTYIYKISTIKPVFNRFYCHYYFGNLDFNKMNKACKILKEYTDFTSFSKLHTDVKTNNCKIIEAGWTEQEGGYEFEIKADRFLRNMVRAIVGTMLDLGAGKMTLEDFRDVIESKDRTKAGMSAEAKGLFLVDIGY